MQADHVSIDDITKHLGKSDHPAHPVHPSLHPLTAPNDMTWPIGLSFRGVGWFVCGPVPNLTGRDDPTTRATAAVPAC